MANTNVPGTTKIDELKHQATSATQQAGAKASEFGRGIVDQAKQLGEKGKEIASQAGDTAQGAIEGLGSQIENLGGKVRENAPSGGWAGTAATTLADSLEASGRYLQEESFSEMTEDMVKVVRRYPLQSVAIGIALGFLVSRAVRS